MRRASGSTTFPVLVPRSPPLWSPASLIRRLSDLDGIFPPGLGWCRSNTRAGARASSAAIGRIEILHRSRLLLHGCVALLGAEPLGYHAGAARVPFRLVPDG